MAKRSVNKRKDENQLAKSLIDEIIEETEAVNISKKNTTSVKLDRLGGLKDGKARADKPSTALPKK
jgi:hypothetical protein